MKKIIISVIAIIISALVIFSLICLYTCDLASCIFYGKPTINGVRTKLSNWYNITLPENVSMEGYASAIAPTEGVYYVVLEYEGNDEEFNSIFSYEENTETLIKYFNEHNYNQLYDITKNFSTPDFDNGYGWIIEILDEKYGDRCAILYFYDLNKLVIFIMYS